MILGSLISSQPGMPGCTSVLVLVSVLGICLFPSVLSPPSLISPFTLQGSAQVRTGFCPLRTQHGAQAQRLKIAFVMDETDTFSLSP